MFFHNFIVAVIIHLTSPLIRRARRMSLHAAMKEVRENYIMKALNRLRHVLGHDGDTSGVDAAEVSGQLRMQYVANEWSQLMAKTSIEDVTQRVFEEADQEDLSSFLKSQKSERLKAQLWVEF